MGADSALQAAILAHGIAEGHVFIDGNKTTALHAMLTFLRINEFDLREPADGTFAAWMFEMSAGLTPEELAERIRTTLAPA